jgi:hypothetical protein
MEEINSASSSLVPKRIRPLISAKYNTEQFNSKINFSINQLSKKQIIALWLPLELDKVG